MTQEPWIHPSPVLHHAWYFTPAHTWCFSGYQTAEVAPAPGLVVVSTGTFLQGEVDLSWYQGGGLRRFFLGGTQGTVSHKRAHQTMP